MSTTNDDPKQGVGVEEMPDLVIDITVDIADAAGALLSMRAAELRGNAQEYLRCGEVRAANRMWSIGAAIDEAAALVRSLHHVHTKVSQAGQS